MIIEYKYPFIYKIYRDKSDKRIIERDKYYRSYFYIKSSETVPTDHRIHSIEKTEKKSIYGDNLIKIICNNPFDIPKLRLLFSETFEADIRFNDRWLLDNVPEIPNENFRKAYLDIETDDMPDIAECNSRINTIGIYDNYTNIYYTFLISSKTGKEIREDHIIYRYINELDMLQGFISFVKEFDFDMIIAHNGDGFDFPVLIGRIQKLGIYNYGRMSPIGVVSRNNFMGTWQCKIGGRILFDIMGVKNTFGVRGGMRGLLNGRDIHIIENGEQKIIRIKRWGLKRLAKFVGLEKGELEKIECEEDMIRYNREDVKIMFELDKYFNVSEYYHDMQILIGCSFEHTFYNTNMIDMFLLRRFSKIVFPSKMPRGKFNGDEIIKGATVDNPIPGLYYKLKYIDQTSLYPTVVVSGNMSPETIDIDGEIDLKNGIRFSNKKQGIIPDAVQFLLDIRLKYKTLAKTAETAELRQKYDLLSSGYKTLLVSFYGALLYQGFRLYNHKIAESIPYMGRTIKEHVRQLVNKYDYTVVGGDTDAAMIVPNHESCIPVDKLIEYINESFDEFANSFGMSQHIFNIELDKEYDVILLSNVKKRYVGYLNTPQGKIFKCVGFESVRRDTAIVTEIMQENVFKLILEGHSRGEVLEYIQKIKEEMRTGIIPLKHCIIPRGFSKKLESYKVVNPWIRGLEYSNKNLGMCYTHFTDLAIVYVKEVPSGLTPTDVVGVDLDTLHILDGFIIDWNTIIEKTIDSKLENILNILGWENSHTQKSIFEF